jgi:hypothetical protein
MRSETAAALRPPHNLVAELPEALRLLPSPIDAAEPWLNNVLSPSASGPLGRGSPSREPEIAPLLGWGELAPRRLETPLGEPQQAGNPGAHLA